MCPVLARELEESCPILADSFDGHAEARLAQLPERNDVKVTFAHLREVRTALRESIENQSVGLANHDIVLRALNSHNETFAYDLGRSGLREFFGAAKVTFGQPEANSVEVNGYVVSARPTKYYQCPRCRLMLAHEENELCTRCESVVSQREREDEASRRME